MASSALLGSLRHVILGPVHAQGHLDATVGFKAVLREKALHLAEEHQRQQLADDQSGKANVDPLGVYAERSKDKFKSCRRRKSRQQAYNVFTSFANEAKAEQENSEVQVDAMGRVKCRPNYIRHSSSDTELRRWRMDLTDTSRFDKLTTDVRQRWHEDFGADRAEMMQRHNALFRQREYFAPDLAHKPVDAAKYLKALQQRLAIKRRHLESMEAQAGRSLPQLEPRRERAHPGASLSETAVFAFLEFMIEKFDDLDTAFHAIDSNKSGNIAYIEFVQSMQTMGFGGDKLQLRALWAKLDRDGNGVVSLPEFQNLKPYHRKAVQARKRTALFESLRKGDASKQCQAEQSDESSLSGSEALSGSELASLDISPRSMNHRLSDTMQVLQSIPTKVDVASRRLAFLASDLPPKRSEVSAESPPTLSILIFRNADPRHTGEPLFVGKRATSLLRLLELCSEACPPVAGTGTALYSLKLRRIRGLDELRAGPLLLKGQEALAPPPAFLALRCLGESSASHSLRGLMTVASTSAGEAELLSPGSSPSTGMRARTASSSHMPLAQDPLPRVGGVPHAVSKSQSRTALCSTGASARTPSNGCPTQSTDRHARGVALSVEQHVVGARGGSCPRHRIWCKLPHALGESRSAGMLTNGALLDGLPENENEL